MKAIRCILCRVAFVVYRLVPNTEHNVTAMKFNEKLKALREHLGFTQDQLAEKLGMTEPSRRSRVSEWEKGLREPKRATLIRYAKLAGIEIKNLIDDDEEISFRDVS